MCGITAIYSSNRPLNTSDTQQKRMFDSIRYRGLDGDGFYLVDDNPESYKKAILLLHHNHKERKELAQRSYVYARENWAPEITELKLFNLHKRYLSL